MVDKRHSNRIKIVQELYSYSYNPKTKLDETAQEITNRIPELDPYIQRSAPKYEIAQIARVDLAILRLALFELIVTKKEPPKVIINEAIETAKDLASDKSPAFVNAVLGAVYREVDPENA